MYVDTHAGAKRGCCYRSLARLTEAMACRRESNRESARRARVRKAEELHALEQQVQRSMAELAERESALACASSAAAEATSKVAQLREERAALLKDVRTWRLECPRLCLQL